MTKRLFVLRYLLTACGLMAFFTTPGYSQGLRDRLEGLVYEVEDWSEPKAWKKDKTSSNKWTFWTTEDKVNEKRSRGGALHTPQLPEKDRANAAEGAPALHTKITGIPNGRYRVWCNPTNRPLAFSFDKGKSWTHGNLGGEEFFGIFDIIDGTFEVWVDDLYACQGDPGWSYYDYIRFVPLDPNEPLPILTNLKSFTLPNGDTQLSWLTSSPMPASTVCYKIKDKRDFLLTKETENNLRNHRVILTGLPKGERCTAIVMHQLNAVKSIPHTIDFTAGKAAQPQATKAAKIKLTVSEPTDSPRSNWPVTSGVPFAKGTLASTADVRLLDEKGTEVPAQFETICRWPDGSVKWLCVHFRAATKKNQPVVFSLETRSGLGTPEKNSHVLSAAQKKTLDELVKKISSRVVLTNGSQYSFKWNDDFKTESVGPLCTTVRGSGDYISDKGKPAFRWACDISFFGGDFVRVRWSVGNNLIAHPMTLVKSIDLSFKTDCNDSFKFANNKTAKSRAAVLQSIEKKATVDCDGDKSGTDHFDGFLETNRGSWYFRDFWQTWPKGLHGEKDSITFDILPELPKGYHPEQCDSADGIAQHYYWLKENSYQFKRGMMLRHDLWYTTRKAADSKALASHFARGLFAVCDPEYYCSTGTFPQCFPARKGQFDYYEASYEKSFQNFLKTRDMQGEYGWMNFGDWFGESIYNWGNNEYDGTYTCILQFMRTGNTKYLDRGIEMARHYSTIDFKSFPWEYNMRELMYIHCYGHVNQFFTKDDPRVQKMIGSDSYGTIYYESDGGGGHAFHPGAFYTTCLTGDRYFSEVAEKACENQAVRYTSNFRFGIERCAGWPMINAVNAYLFTGNPFYLNAADLYFEAIYKQQNKETGCFDLLQDQNECNCPDKKTHRGGKAFAVGILTDGLIRYYELTKKQEARDTVVRCADWLLDCSWNEEKHGFRYKTGCAKYANNGWYTILAVEALAFAGEVTGNARYHDFLIRTLGPELTKVTGTGRSAGKSFSMQFRQTPHALYYLQKRGITNLKTDVTKDKATQRVQQVNQRPTGAGPRQPRGSAYWERHSAADPSQRTLKKQRAVSAVQKEPKFPERVVILNCRFTQILWSQLSHSSQLSQWSHFPF